uniref:Uncharacterized protein n=1 Tax=Macrostomum lignano TaxID=282301 RepID=A0A1I8FD54_9PLAT
MHLLAANRADKASKSMEQMQNFANYSGEPNCRASLTPLQPLRATWRLNLLSTCLAKLAQSGVRSSPSLAVAWPIRRLGSRCYRFSRFRWTDPSGLNWRVADFKQNLAVILRDKYSVHLPTAQWMRRLRLTRRANAAVLEMESLPLHLRRQLAAPLRQPDRSHISGPYRRRPSVAQEAFATSASLYCATWTVSTRAGGGVLSNEQLAINQLYPDSLTAAASLTSDATTILTAMITAAGGGGNVGSPVSIGFDKFDVVDDVDAGIDGAPPSLARLFVGEMFDSTAHPLALDCTRRRFSASRCLSKGLSDWTMTACQRQVLRRPLSPAAQFCSGPAIFFSNLPLLEALLSRSAACRPGSGRRLNRLISITIIPKLANAPAAATAGRRAAVLAERGRPGGSALTY